MMALAGHVTKVAFVLIVCNAHAVEYSVTESDGLGVRVIDRDFEADIDAEAAERDGLSVREIDRENEAGVAARLAEREFDGLCETRDADFEVETEHESETDGLARLAERDTDTLCVAARESVALGVAEREARESEAVGDAERELETLEADAEREREGDRERVAEPDTDCASVQVSARPARKTAQRAARIFRRRASSSPLSVNARRVNRAPRSETAQATRQTNRNRSEIGALRRRATAGVAGVEEYTVVTKRWNDLMGSRPRFFREWTLFT